MYRGSYRCKDCNYNFSRITKAFPKKDPNCPQCKKADKLKCGGIVSDKTHAMEPVSTLGGTPDNPQKTFSMGPSNFTKAMDATSEIVMRDYAMTNLQDNLREGDSMAPKLRPDLEQQVDQVFKPQKPIMGQNTATNLNKALTSQINAGKYAGQSGDKDITARAKNSGYKVPVNEVFNYQGKPN